MVKGLLTICAALVMLLTMLIWFQWPEDTLRIIFCDVGQGDAILIIDGFSQILVDGGGDDRVMNCLSQHIPFWDKTLEMVVATHADADHIGGLAQVLHSFAVLSVLTTSQSKESADFDRFSTALDYVTSVHKTKIIRPQINTRIILTNRVKATVLWPDDNKKENNDPYKQAPETTLSDKLYGKNAVLNDKYNYNDGSIVLFLTLDNVRVLLTGDLEERGEKALLESDLIQDVDILKVGHHGAKTSSSPAFLAILKPEKSIISAGYNNQYNHPSPEVIKALRQISSDILRTDTMGTIEFLVNDSQYHLR